jgi:SsrA-binding protein
MGTRLGGQRGHIENHGTRFRAVNESGLAIVPVTLYFKDGRAKVQIALARGAKTWDKRNALAEREASREAARAVSRRLKGRPD